MKYRLYACAGIPEVWSLDVGARRLTVHRSPSRDGYAAEWVVGAGDVVAPAAFPEDGVDVADWSFRGAWDGDVSGYAVLP